MLDKRTWHMKVQEECDCFATEDPLKEMAGLKGESNAEEGALKWFALAVLHGINDNAKKITICRNKAGEVTVMAKYRKSELPDPGSLIGEKIFEVIRGITHIEDKKGKLPVVIGIRDSSVEIEVKVKQKDGEEEIKLKFPK
ncbi:MAG: hypothetical protein AAGU11_10415 [Syntrophobacteraceae bacterium]